MVLAHFGSMDDWVKRDPEHVLRAAEELLAEGQIPLGAIRFDFYGPAGARFIRLSRARLDSGLMTIRGPVAHEEATSLLRECDVALLLMWPLDTHSMPMKATEYMAYGKTVLVLDAGETAEVRSVLAGTPGVLFCDDLASTKDAVMECWCRFAATGDIDWPESSRARPFGAAAMTDDFECVFGAVLHSPEAPA